MLVSDGTLTDVTAALSTTWKVSETLVSAGNEIDVIAELPKYTDAAEDRLLRAID
jgi:hypothetical protein